MDMTKAGAAVVRSDEIDDKLAELERQMAELSEGKS